MSLTKKGITYFYAWDEENKQRQQNSLSQSQTGQMADKRIGRAKLDQPISVDRLERVEKGRANPTPFDIKEFAKAYGEHTLCKHYRVHEYEIGKGHNP